MKKQLLHLLFLGMLYAASGQETAPVFHPIDAKRPTKTYFQPDLVRLHFRNMEELLMFAASEFDAPPRAQLAVLLDQSFVGKLDAAGHFTQMVDEKKMLEIPIDSIRMVVSDFDPDFRTRHSSANFFGKINITARPVRPPDTVAWNRFEPERIVVNRTLFMAEYREMAAVAVRGGWFLGKIGGINSVQAGSWLEIPLSRRAALLAEFSFSNKKELLGRFIKTPFEEFTYSINEWQGHAGLKYYLSKKYQRPYLLAGCFVGRASGQLHREREMTPPEFLGTKTGFGIRFGIGYQFFSGFYAAISAAPVFGKRENLLPFQQTRVSAISLGWMIGRR